MVAKQKKLITLKKPKTKYTLNLKNYTHLKRKTTSIAGVVLCYIKTPAEATVLHLAGAHMKY